jgi:hypothetical protein
VAMTTRGVCPLRMSTSPDIVVGSRLANKNLLLTHEDHKSV